MRIPEKGFTKVPRPAISHTVKTGMLQIVAEISNPASVVSYEHPSFRRHVEKTAQCRYQVDPSGNLNYSTSS